MDKEENINKFPTININEEPSTTYWRFPSLFKADLKGAEREWFGAFDGNGIITSYGQVGGIMQITDPYVIETNLSGRCLQEQALLELRHRYELKQIKDGYRFKGDSPPEQTQPMLSQIFDSKRITNYPVAVQPKLDGIRCLVRETDERTIIYRSRGNKYFQVNRVFDEEIKRLLSYFPMKVELDGELYVHGMKLQEITPFVKTEDYSVEQRKKLTGQKGKRIKEVLDKRDKILTYNIFTIITPQHIIFEERQELLEKAFVQAGKKEPFRKIKVVDSILAIDEDEIMEITHEFEEEGYEGSIVYKMGENLPESLKKDSYYLSGRRYNIMKVKNFCDEEGVVVEVSEAKGSSAGLAMVHVKDKNGIVTTMSPNFDDKTRRRWFKHPEEIVGKIVTFKFQERTLDGKLRHPNMIAIRDYE